MVEDKKKVLKIAIGEVYIDGKNHTVYQTAWKVEDKDFYRVSLPIFVNEVKPKAKESKNNVVIDA